MLIGCTRMYNATPGVARLWRELLEGVATRAGVEMEVIDYPSPAPLDALWAREDIGSVFMCGWPFRRAQPKPQIVAAPVPVTEFCDGARYCTVMVVRQDAPYTRLEDTFGGRIAWTEKGSHSGLNAPRKMLLAHRRDDGQPLYRESVGPVISPRASLNSVLEGRADIAPLDSYFYQLLRKHDPEAAAKVRVIARTDCAPIPVLVAAPGQDADTVASLGEAFEATSGDATFGSLLEALCLQGFARVPDPERYSLTEQWDCEARDAGYIEIG